MTSPRPTMKGKVSFILANGYRKVRHGLLACCILGVSYMYLMSSVDATSMQLSPFLFTAIGSALLSKSSFTRSVCPGECCSNQDFLLALAFMRRILRLNNIPSQRSDKGLLLLSSGLSRKVIVNCIPLDAAMCRAVCPFLVLIFTERPASNSLFYRICQILSQDTRLQCSLNICSLVRWP